MDFKEFATNYLNRSVPLFGKEGLGEILLAPDLLYLEVVNTAQRCGVPVNSVVDLLEAQQYLLDMRAVTNTERKKAIEIW